jgi:periplasmic protein TonB
MPESAQRIPAPDPAAPASRRRSLPATGLPASREDRRGSGAVSALLHLLIVILIAWPAALHTGEVIERAQGAGGPGPAGGGGGGHRGTGGIRERVTYVKVVQAQPAPTPKPVVPPPVVPPKPKPVVIPPPEVIKAPDPIPAPKIAEPKVAELKVEATAPAAGTGGGTGNDGTAGNGPGTGGGVGSGIGKGRGSGIGPGTGGGSQANYPPTPTELFIPPLPIPNKAKGFHLVAEYDVDETGKVVGFTFTPTRDGGYNRRLEEVLKSFKFRPGTTPDGMPIRMKAQIVYDF